jgi:hypothetical protein
MGSGLEKFGPGGKARGNNWRLTARRKKRADKHRAKERGVKSKRNEKGRHLTTTGRKRKRRDAIKEGRKGRRGDVQRRGFRFAEICGD